MVDDETLDHIRRELGKMHPHDLKKLLPGRKRANGALRDRIADLEDQLAKGEAIAMLIEEILSV